MSRPDDRDMVRLPSYLPKDLVENYCIRSRMIAYDPRADTSIPR